MYDPRQMYPSSYHPVKTNQTRDLSAKVTHTSRSQKPPKYYFVDFGISRRYLPEQLPALEPVILGGDKSPPEHQGRGAQADPFPTDVYLLGHMIEMEFLQVCAHSVLVYSADLCFRDTKDLNS
jgi:hypothetical protein